MDRSPFRTIIFVIVGIALACAFFLPAMKVSAISLFGGGTGDLSLVDSVKALREEGYLWGALIAGLGALIVIAGAFLFNEEYPGPGRLALTVGTILTLALPLGILLMGAKASDEAEEQGFYASISLGMGVIAAVIALIIAAGVAWYASTRPDRQGSLVSSPSSSGTKPAWMASDGHDR